MRRPGAAGGPGARVGDRKEELDYVSGATTLGPDIRTRRWRRDDLAAGRQPARRPPCLLGAADARPVRRRAAARPRWRSPRPPAAGPSRKGTSSTSTWRSLPPGRVRRGGRPDRGGPSSQPRRRDRDRRQGCEDRAVAALRGQERPTGIYTFLLKGTGPYPFSKDPNAKTKPNINLSEPSNPSRSWSARRRSTWPSITRGGAQARGKPRGRCRGHPAEWVRRCR